MMHRRTILAAAVATLAGLSACRQSTVSHQVVAASAEPIRENFNSQAGKVRLIMLLSPT